MTTPPTAPDATEAARIGNISTDSPAEHAGLHRDRTFSGTSSTSSWSSFDNMRPHPPSPRTQRHPSLSQAAVQELINHPPTTKAQDPRFKGRDWRRIKIGELVSRDDVRFVEKNITVEDATKLLVDLGPPHVIIIRDDPNSLTATGTFDYNDLNAYLLVVLGLAHPTEDNLDLYTEIANKAQEGKPIPLGDVISLAKKAPLVTLTESQDLSQAIEYFSGGVHRLLVLKEGTSDVIGVFSQWKLVNFLWEYGSNFQVIDNLYPKTLRDLDIGSHQIISVNGDKPLTEALQLMNNEGLSSLAVVDNSQNVVGNISTTDVRHLTKTSALRLLKSSCIHFISVILSSRGLDDGKDSFPVFYVNPYSTLAHTVAKLVATTSQRMWVTEGPSPSPSTPSTPAAVPSVLAVPHSNGPSSPPLSPSYPSMSASAFPGARISGRLTGVVSLTDVLNLFARQSGLQTSDPSEERTYRRRSSSISLRPSIDSGRGSSVDMRR